MDYVHITPAMFVEQTSKFGFDTLKGTDYNYMWEITCSKNCDLLLSVKIPHQRGKGIHMSVFFVSKDKKYFIGSKEQNSVGHYSTGYIRHSKKWKENVDNIIRKSMFIYRVKYNNQKLRTVQGKYNKYLYCGDINVTLENQLMIYDNIIKTKSNKIVIELLQKERIVLRQPEYDNFEFEGKSLSELRDMLEIKGKYYLESFLIN